MKRAISLGFLFLLSTTATVAFAITCGHGGAKGWSQLKGQIISSVAWSPDGRHVAFVVTPKQPPNSDLFVITKASIWLTTVGPKIGAPRRLRTVKLSTCKAYGAPVGLFWLSEKKLGWAAAGCKFYIIDLQNGKTRALGNLRVMLEQSRAFQPAYGLDDVYYDPRSYQLIVTGFVPSAPYSVAYLYDTRTGKLRNVSFPEIDVRLTMSSWTSPFRTHGSYKRDYYVAGQLFNDRMILRRASGDPHNQVERLAKGENRDGIQQIFFPRPSPDGRRLLWMESPPDVSNRHYNRWSLVLFHTRTRTRKVIAHIPDARYWNDIIPALGCPFSWSPKSDHIAYAHGSVTRILPVGKSATSERM